MDVYFKRSMPVKTRKRSALFYRKVKNSLDYFGLKSPGLNFESLLFKFSNISIFFFSELACDSRVYI